MAAQSGSYTNQDSLQFPLLFLLRSGSSLVASDQFLQLFLHQSNTVNLLFPILLLSGFPVRSQFKTSSTSFRLSSGDLIETCIEPRHLTPGREPSSESRTLISAPIHGTLNFLCSFFRALKPLGRKHLIQLAQLTIWCVNVSSLSSTKPG
jgi:hypothetical protein